MFKIYIADYLAISIDFRFPNNIFVDISIKIIIFLAPDIEAINQGLILGS